MKRLSTIVIAVAALGAAGWWGYQSQRTAPRAAVEIGPGAGAPQGASKGAPTATTPGAAGGGPRQAIGVEAVAAEVMALSDDVSGIGTLFARESVVIKPEIAGRITRVAFTDGAQVAKGAVLVELDRSVLAAQVAQSRAELALSRTSYERTVDLAKQNFVSASARDQAYANLRVQQAKLQLAEAQLEKTTIRAPFSGVLGLKRIGIGEYVREGTEMVVIEDVSTMKVDLRLPERYAGRIQRGLAMQLAVESLPGRTFQATVDALDVQIDAEGRSLVIRGRLANPDGVLRSGMFVKSRVVLKEKPDAVVVPEEAIIPTGNDAYVYRIDDGKARRVPVTLGIRRDGKVEIASGLEAGTMVVTAGQLRLTRDNMDVRVIAGNGAPASPAGPGSAGAHDGKGAAGSAARAPTGAPASPAPPAGSSGSSGAGGPRTGIDGPSHAAAAPAHG